MSELNNLKVCAHVNVLLELKCTMPSIQSDEPPSYCLSASFIGDRTGKGNPLTLPQVQPLPIDVNLNNPTPETTAWFAQLGAILVQILTGEPDDLRSYVWHFPYNGLDDIVDRVIVRLRHALRQ